MILEEMKGGDLLDRLSEKEVYSEHAARRLSRTLIEAVDYCHKKGFVHRDIKPENILLVDKENDFNIKLADFGCAKQITGEPNFCQSMVGSPEYVAPEIYVHEDGYDQRCDLWSIGVVIYVLMAGYCPFEAPPDQLPTIICEGYFDFDAQEWSKISNSPKELIKSLLQVDVMERATINDALSSDWLRRRDTLTDLDFNSSFNVWLQKQPHFGATTESTMADSASSFDLDAIIEADEQNQEQQIEKTDDNNINGDVIEDTCLKFSESSNVIDDGISATKNACIGFSGDSSQDIAVADAAVEAESTTKVKAKIDEKTDDKTNHSIKANNLNDDAIAHTNTNSSVDINKDENSTNTIEDVKACTKTDAKIMSNVDANAKSNVDVNTEVITANDTNAYVQYGAKADAENNLSRSKHIDEILYKENSDTIIDFRHQSEKYVNMNETGEEDDDSVYLNTMESENGTLLYITDVPQSKSENKEDPEILWSESFTTCELWE